MKKEYKIGIAGIVALVALFLGINFLKGKALFGTSAEYYVSFDNAKGLAKSSIVYIDGYDVGVVSDIIYDFNTPGNILVEISVDPRLVIYHGSKITLDNGLMGGCTMNISSSTDRTEAYKPGDTIPGDNKNGLIQKAEDMIPKVLMLTDKLDTLITSLNAVVKSPHVTAILGNVEQATQDLTLTTKHLNNLLSRDIPTLTSTYTRVGDNMLFITENFKALDLRPTIDSVNTTISNVNAVVKQMRDPNGTLGALITDRSLYNTLNTTVADADSLLVDLKAHPKRYVHFSVFGRKDKK